ncbi:integral membrane protein pth11 [Fusarium beomiforme]|uniref:Integral membrane protein pth11 n=1 Tax=Fusarium beomiforme TaxID=44412 RepID=A0A9P5A5C1_9HYPO|nr:integral membrane protein pth11 [Fusarium beomiforme]
MAVKGEGPWVIGAMWALTVVTFIFVILRAYTRIFVVKSFGIDDHVYNLAFICLLLDTIFTTVAVHYGVGQNMTDVIQNNPDDLAPALIFEAVGQTFAIVGMSLAKWSLGLFLLRLVKQQWHKVAIWVSMASLMCASITVCFVYWLQCSPPNYLWDRTIPGGRCTVDTAPASLVLCILCVVVDFFLAGFPWLFIWGLQMKMKEKIVILSSLSLGVIAGAFGIKRTLEVPKLASPNHTKDPVGLIVWTAAEITVTMICIGIAVCRPLYKKCFSKWSSRNSSKYREHNSGASYPLQTIGGSTRYPAQVHKKDSTAEASVKEYERKGARIEYSKSKVFAQGAERGYGENQSEEEILGPDFRRSRHYVEERYH